MGQNNQTRRDHWFKEKLSLALDVGFKRDVIDQDDCGNWMASYIFDSLVLGCCCLERSKERERMVIGMGCCLRTKEVRRRRHSETI